jgi:hypothetical protein
VLGETGIALPRNANASMQEMFLLDANRTDKFNLKWNDFFTGLFKNIINQRNDSAIVGIG